MGEEGLVAIHKIINNINDQEEQIWRKTASKKCLKKEIEKIEEQTKRYEMQIATLKKDPLHKKKENIKQSLEDNIKDHLQNYKLLSLTLHAKNEEIERKSEEIKSWDKKYKHVISELKEAYDIKKALYESINPMCKKLMEVKAYENVVEVSLKQLEASLERRQKSQKQLDIIKKGIFHKTILNSVNAVLRKNKYVEVSSKLKILTEKKKKMVQDMFEEQEAMKKSRVSHTNNKIPGDMFSRRITTLNTQPGMTNRNEKRKFTEFLPDFNKLNKRLNVYQRDDCNQVDKPFADTSNLEREQPMMPPTPKRKPPLLTNRINIHTNKIITLPPLKTIFTKRRSGLNTSNRSFGDVSFNRSQNSQIHSQTEMIKTIDPTPRSSQESQIQAELNQSIQQAPNVNKDQQKELPATNIAKPLDYLKNLKFTTQSNKFDSPNKSNSLNLQNTLKSQLQKASILKSQLCKKKMDESVQDFDLSQRKKEKNVNFASPIQQQIEINQQISSPEAPSMLSSPISMPSNRDMSGSSEGNMWMTTNNGNDDEFQVGCPNFSFAESNDIPSEKNASNMPQDSIFGGTNDAQSAFGFNFGGSSKAGGALWDLFG